MSTLLTVVVERQPAGEPLEILPRVLNGLDALAMQLGCPPLTSFVREDPDLFAEIADQFDEETRKQLAHRIEKQAEWHDASTGLAAVQRLLEFLRQADPQSLPSQFSEVGSDLVVQAILAEEGKALVEALGEDLERCSKELKAAAQQGRKFHFNIG
jgi:hypothetical protein